MTAYEVVKKHLYLHPYTIISVHELKERDNIKRVGYCPWFRDVIIANGEDILDVTFIWLHQQPKQPRLVSD
jgi:hypothetical protein